MRGFYKALPQTFRIELNPFRFQLGKRHPARQTFRVIMLQKRDRILAVEMVVRKMRMAQENNLMTGLAIMFIDVFKHKVLSAERDAGTKLLQKLPLERVLPRFAELYGAAQRAHPFHIPEVIINLGQKQRIVLPDQGKGFDGDEIGRAPDGHVRLRLIKTVGCAIISHIVRFAASKNGHFALKGPARSAIPQPTLPKLRTEPAMIPRYSRQDMVDIWSPESKFRIWFEIEAHACDALAELGVIPQDAAKTIWEKGGSATFDIDRIDEIERETKHDVIAFLTHLAEIVGPDARFVHQGMTSSDVLDTCFNVQLVKATDLLLEDMDKLLEAIKRRAYEHKDTVTIGRSHGIHAEPVTFGLKMAQAYAEFDRCKARLQNAREEIATGAISGAVGTFANIDPRVEEHVAKALGLQAEPVSTQVIPRDRHAMYFATLGVIASSIERLATEIRHLQRTEVLEAEEFFSKGQKGSSAMPHKRNPVLTENLTGLARLVRMSTVPAMENVALWHERDISHSSVERMIGPDTTVTLDFALARLTGVIDKLVVYPERMMGNMDRLGGLVHSQRILLALTQAGSSREDAYRLVQRNAMKVWDSYQVAGSASVDFLTELLNDEDVRNYLSEEEIRDRFDLGYHTKNVDVIFERVFGES